MATVERRLPERPHLDVPKREARELLKQCRARVPEALGRIRRRHPQFREADTAARSARKFLLNDAQLVVAREYGFSTWAELKERIDGDTVAGLLQEAIHKDDRETVVRCCGRIQIFCIFHCGAELGAADEPCGESWNAGDYQGGGSPGGAAGQPGPGG